MVGKFPFRLFGGCLQPTLDPQIAGKIGMMLSFDFTQDMFDQQPVKIISPQTGITMTCHHFDNAVFDYHQ